MSMIGNFRLARSEDIARLLDDPEQIEAFLFGELDENEDGPDPGGMLDVDKAWHGIHFLLTGTAWEGEPPLDFIVRGGRQIGDVDVGYGPARAFTNEELRDIGRAIQPISLDTLRSRFDAARMKALKIYPDIWDRDSASDDTLGYLISYYEMLQPFIIKGAADGFGMIVYLT